MSYDWSYYIISGICNANEVIQDSPQVLTSSIGIGTINAYGRALIPQTLPCMDKKRIGLKNEHMSLTISRGTTWLIRRLIGNTCKLHRTEN